MGRLFKLKEWLTVADAAKHLSTVFEEDVTEADVLRFALDDELQLSANFVNEAYCRVGTLVPLADATYTELGPIRGTEPVRIYRGPEIFTGGLVSHILELEEDVSLLHGVYDLAMLGGEKQDVETRYQRLTGGPAITAVPMDGAFVKLAGNQYCQIQDDFEDNEYVAGSRAQLERIEGMIAERDYDAATAKSLLDQHHADRKKFLEERKSRQRTSFYPGGHLPHDAVFVVRAQALTEFIADVHARETDGGDPTEPPFFDADSRDYPMLLHIAVNAWNHAKTQTGGTPKQRISAYVAARYPHIKEATREAIAMIANWEKGGGRPKKGE